MNAQKAKTIPVEHVLSKMGIFPQKVSGSDLWYFSPFSTEKTPSFKINQKINRWYCHSTGCGGNTLDFVIKKTECSISEALSYLKDFNFSFSFQKQISEIGEIKNENIPTIIKIIPIQHSALIQYLNQRGITKFRSVKQLKEIHYSIQEKKYFALSFENSSEGFEVRNKYAKLCLLKKDITLISNNSNKLKVFEGYFDYLSFVNIENLEKEKTDYLILNSVALLNKNISILSNYTAIELYLDNDEAGDKYTSLILNQFPTAQDCRTMYKGFKDLNEYHIAVGLNEGFI
ncbi:toprim domain-containing protein [Flavobacterium sp. TAB 87]|uniref:toprim domain-containing protein n=1 Tax=Flavobacterium sp. TAB 87 TaxID=1729581 RepID=UPI00076BC41D|nr:toprim domain-containing protein [Flavobacterium sp. TAB 87]KVV13407.1 DNA primase [Flavobacterium sp. TAB 87]